MTRKKFDEEFIKNHQDRKQYPAIPRTIEIAFHSSPFALHEYPRFEKYLLSSTYERLAKDLKELGVSTMTHSLSIPEPRLITLIIKSSAESFIVKTKTAFNK